MTSRTTKFDVLMATDCRFPGGNTSSVVEEIEAQHRAGYRTGLLHLPSPVLTKPRPFASKLRKVLDEGKAELVLGADRVEAGLLLARHPTVFTDPPRGLPQIEAEHVVLAVNQVARDDRGVEPYYDVPHVHRQIERMMGKEATWAPIGPRVRESLEAHSATIPVLPWDWENVIDVTAWQVERAGFVSDRPVIGRHSRGHWTKWPDTKQDILAAYPPDPRYKVRILGGTTAPAQILDRIPANWVDLPFDSVSPRDFLATIDFFVYFHHPGLVEAFGRVVLEALSAGAVVIGPPYLERLFGDACLYGTPADVRRLVDQLYSDWDAFAARSRAGVELARKRFSYETHAERVAKLIGKPSGHPVVDAAPASSKRKKATGGRTARRQPEPSGHAAQHGGTLVVDLRWDTGGTPLLSRVIQEAAGDDAPCAVVVPAWRAPEAARPSVGGSAARSRRNRNGELAVETFPWVVAEMPAGERRRYLAHRLSGLVAAHHPARTVIIEGARQDAQVALGAVASGGAEVLRVHPVAASPAANVADVVEAPAWLLPEGWTVARHVSRASAGGNADKLVVRLRRKAPSWARTRARRFMSSVRRTRVRMLERLAPNVGLVLFETTKAELNLPVRAPVSHPLPERLPIALAVVSGEDVDPEATLRALVERAQITAAFRPAVLAPPEWVDEAVGFGVTLETLVPKSRWEELYGAGWEDYLRRRVDETCHVVHPATVAFVDRTIDPAGRGGASAPSAVLDVVEAAHTRSRA